MAGFQFFYALGIYVTAYGAAHFAEGYGYGETYAPRPTTETVMLLVFIDNGP